MVKGFKVRLYPTKDQEGLILNHINTCRFMWNHMLSVQNARKENSEKYLSTFDMNKYLTELKKQEQYDWLNNVSVASLQRVNGDINNAFQRFFKRRSSYPSYKKKKESRQSYPVSIHSLYFEKQYVNVEKIGHVKYKSDLVIPLGKNAKFINPRISLINGKYILSFCMSCENQATMTNNYSMGIDLGVKNLATVSYSGNCLIIPNINKTTKMIKLEQAIYHQNKVVFNKTKIAKQSQRKNKSNNLIKAEEKLKRLIAKRSNIRKDYLHKATSKIINLKPRRIVMETLLFDGVTKYKNLQNAVKSEMFYEFKRQIEYKSEWNGIEFYLADKYFPSSKKCSRCGNIDKTLTMKARTYKCDVCGFSADRDINAAINLENYGIL